MRPLLALAFLSISACSGCSVAPFEATPTHFACTIGPEFSDADMLDIHEAIDDWTRKTDGRFACVDPSEAAGSLTFHIAKPGQIPGYGRSFFTDGVPGGDIVVSPTIPKFYQAQALAHEIGHILIGPEHYEGPEESIMKANPPCSFVVTDRDVRAFNQRAGGKRP